MQTKHLKSIALAVLMLFSVGFHASIEAGMPAESEAVAKVGLAESLIKKQRFKDAQLILERELSPYAQSQQLSAPKALELADLLVVTYRDQSFMQAALDLAQKTYERSEQTLGRNDLKTLRRFQTLAQIKLRMSLPEAYQMHVDLVARIRAAVASHDVLLARALAETAEAAMVVWAPAAANQYLAESIEIFKRQKYLDPVDMVYLQSLVAAQMRWRGDFLNAKLISEEALQSAKNLREPDPVILGRVLLNNGHIYTVVGDKQQALEKYQSAYEILNASLGGRHFYTLDASRNMALAMLSMGDVERAKSLINESMSFAEQAYGKDTLYLAGWMADYARALMDQGRFEDALGLLKRAEGIALISLKETDLPLAYGFELIAQCYASMSQYDQELIYRKKAYLAYERSLGPNNYLTLYRKNGLAHTFNALGQYKVSAQMYKEVADQYRVQFGEQSENYANVTVSWALAQANFDRNFDSKPYLEQSLKTLNAIATDSSISVIRLKQHLAFVYMNANEDKKALAMLAEIKKYAQGADLVAIYTGESQLYRKLGESEMAYAAASDALNLSEELSSQLLAQSRAAMNMSVILQSSGDLKGAIYWSKIDVNLLQEIRSRVKNIGQQELQGYTESVAWAYQWLAFLLINENRLPEAQQVLEMLKEEEQFQFIRRSNSDAVDRSRIAYTPFESKWNDKQKQLSQNIISISKERTGLQERVRLGLSTQESNRLKSLDVELKQARKAYGEFLSDLRQAMLQRGRVAEQDVSELTLKTATETQSLIKKLGSDVVLVQYFITDQSVNMLLTTGDAQVARSTNIKLAELNLRVAAFRRMLRDPKIDPTPSAKILYDILVRPIEGDLNQAKAKTVMLSLTGALSYIPFSALHDGTEFIVKRWRLPIYTTVTKTKLLDPVHDQWSAVGLGLTRKVGDFSALPAVKDEIQSIVKSGRKGILPGEIYLDEAFTANKLRDVASRKFDVLHIASHFRLSPGTEVNSFLLLGDGTKLTLGEIREKNYRFDNVDMLTLSACDTGLGGGRNEKGQEIEGFGVVAQGQGAKSVLATLWTVEDKSTSLLMSDMYKRRQRNGLTKIEALSDSQNLLMSSKEYSHPFFWAPFILMGNWR
jgi:CHAT domain-containing protein